MRLIFRRAWQLTGNLWSFAFEPPADLYWTAGQSVRLEVPGEYGPLEHRFTIASIPPDGELVIATRLSGSAYKRALQRLRPGDFAQAYGVEGTFVWGPDISLRRVFVAAGVGVTPFYAMVKQRLQAEAAIPATLLYATPDAPPAYWEFFVAAQKKRPEFRVEYFLNQHVSAAMAASFADVSDSLIYIAGPSAMVDQVAVELSEAYQVPAGRLKRDWYTGRLGFKG